MSINFVALKILLLDMFASLIRNAYSSPQNYVLEVLIFKHYLCHLNTVGTSPTSILFRDLFRDIELSKTFQICHNYHNK